MFRKSNNVRLIKYNKFLGGFNASLCILNHYDNIRGILTFLLFSYVGSSLLLLAIVLFCCVFTSTYIFMPLLLPCLCYIVSLVLLLAHHSCFLCVRLFNGIVTLALSLFLCPITTHFCCFIDFVEILHFCSLR